MTSATEHRAGTYVYNDRAMVRAGHCTLDDCAMHILATVVSRPTPDRAILDAGSKALTSDLLGFTDFGLIVEYPDAVITGLSPKSTVRSIFPSYLAGAPEIGERLRIVPNHTCVVSNLFDRMVFPSRRRRNACRTGGRPRSRLVGSQPRQREMKNEYETKAATAMVSTTVPQAF